MDYTILLIDDELEMCLSLAEFLREEGYRTLYTIHPLEVAEILDKEPVDLLIMDIKMPGIGGIELLKTVKTYDPSIAVLMITGYPDDDNIAQALKYGAVNVYTKPLKLAELLKEIHELAVNPVRTTGI